MTKAAGIYEFWASFGIPAYEENSVPTDAEFPYITYELVTDNFENTVVMTASVWYRETSWVNINKKTEEISKKIEESKSCVKIDGGRMWIKRGSPFASSMGDPDDDLIKRKIINLEVEYFTNF